MRTRPGRGGLREVDHTVKVRLTIEQKARLRMLTRLTGKSESAVLADIFSLFWKTLGLTDTEVKEC
ncbi:hypothetical protein ACX27O_24905 [Micromonospora sp. SD19]